MKTVDLIQGTPAWHEHRSRYWNASDAPAMLGASPYKTRAQLLRELATGVTPDVDAATQERFNAGHRFEELARPLAEKIIGEDLYPCVGVEGRLSASFDGLTLLGDVAFEHKTLGAELRALLVRAEGGESITGADLPEHYRIQVEQQCLVSGAQRVLFMATRWEGDTLVEQFWCWYTPDLEMRARIVAGWEQFATDLAAYQPEPAEAPKPIAAPVEGFGVLALRVEGRVLASNLDAFRAGADAFLARLPKPAELQTDQDFVDADAAVKACEDAEAKIKAATELALAQMSDVDAVLRAAKTVAETIRSARLALAKAVATEKDNRKAELVRAGVDAVRAHYDRINATLGEHAMQFPAGLAGGVGQSIKGLKTLASMRAAIDAVVADMKIDASQKADMARACMAILAEHAEHAHLFPDRVMLCANKRPEDLRNLVAARIVAYKRQEEVRERIGRQLEADLAGPQMAKCDGNHGGPRCLDPECWNDDPAPVKAAAPGARMRLGDINAAIVPLSITGEGLAKLGFHPVATVQNAKFYDEASFESMLSALARTIARAHLRREAA